jgi:hypothetical protein
MFIYFPEFLYRKSKEFTKNTFKPQVNIENAREQIKDTLTNPEFQHMIRDLKNNKIRLPTIDYKHCITFDSLKPTSNYDQIDNKITICSNLVDNIDEIFRKEFTYFYEANITLSGKDKNIENISKMAIKACRNSITNINKHIKTELIRRCAYYELKHRFNIDNPDLIKKYIELNYFN